MAPDVLHLEPKMPRLWHEITTIQVCTLHLEAREMCPGTAYVRSSPLSYRYGVALDSIETRVASWCCLSSIFCLIRQIFSEFSTKRTYIYILNEELNILVWNFVCVGAVTGTRNVEKRQIAISRRFFFVWTILPHAIPASNGCHSNSARHETMFFLTHGMHCCVIFLRLTHECTNDINRNSL